MVEGLREMTEGSSRALSSETMARRRAGSSPFRGVRPWDTS